MHAATDTHVAAISGHLYKRWSLVYMEMCFMRLSGSWGPQLDLDGQCSDYFITGDWFCFSFYAGPGGCHVPLRCWCEGWITGVRWALGGNLLMY